MRAIVISGLAMILVAGCKKQEAPKLGPKLKDFRDGLSHAPEGKFPEIDALKAEVEAFAATFPTIGFDKAEGKYTQSL